MEILNFRSGFGDGAGRVPLPFSVAPQRYERSVIFTEVSRGFLFNTVVSHYRGLDGRVAVKSGNLKLEEDVFGLLNKGNERVIVRHPDGMIEEKIVKTDEFATVEIHKESNGSGCKFASAIWDGSSGISAISRNIQNLVRPNPGINDALGYTSAMGLVTGPITVLDSMSALQTAKKIGDVAGARLARMGIAKGVLETGSGAVMGGVRTLSLVALSTTSKVITVAGPILGMTSTVSSCAIFAIYAAGFVRTLARAVPLLMKLRKAPDEGGEAFCVLTSMLTLTEDERERCGDCIRGKTPYELDKMLTEGVELTEKEAEILTMSDQRYVESEIPEETSGRENLIARYMKEIARVKMVKEAEYQRTVGGNSLSMLREYQKQGVVSSSQMAEIVKTAQADLSMQMVRQALLLFGVLLGIASFIVTTVFTGGAPLIIGLVMMLVMNIILTTADTEGMLRSFQNLKNSSTKERVVIALMMFLTIGATTAGAFFTGGGSLLIVALLIGALMLSVQAGGMAYACYKHKNEVKDDSRKVPELPIGRERSSLQFVDGLSV